MYTYLAAAAGPCALVVVGLRVPPEALAEVDLRQVLHWLEGNWLAVVSGRCCRVLVHDADVDVYAAKMQLTN